jgi:UDPglucose--hexose-1-phosphate uridylyltransferase
LSDETGGFPTEIPEADYDIAVFENRFPSLSSTPPEPAIASTELYPVEQSFGECEVVVYTPNHNSTLAKEPVGQIYKLIQVWTDRFRDLSKLEFVRYVFIFETKARRSALHCIIRTGRFTLTRSFRRASSESLRRRGRITKKTGRDLIGDILDEERKDGRRIVAENDSFAAYIPFFARYPYELHIAPLRNVQDLTQMTENEQRDLAVVLKQVLSAFDRLFDVSFPYMMVLHGQPSDDADYSFYRFHIEFYPPLRTATKLKYLAGSESGAGMFINDTLAEEKAAELRAKIEDVVWE